MLPRTLFHCWRDLRQQRDIGGSGCVWLFERLDHRSAAISATLAAALAATMACAATAVSAAIAASVVTTAAAVATSLATRSKGPTCSASSVACHATSDGRDGGSSTERTLPIRQAEQ